MIYCVGRNYAQHIQELGNAVPEEMVLFFKPPTAQVTSSVVSIPHFTKNLHYECELIVRIGRDGRHLRKEDALSYIDAVSVGIDFTARDVQEILKQKGLPWEKAKAFDNSAVVGQWMDIQAYTHETSFVFSLTRNKQVVQKGDTKYMLYTIAEIVSEVSSYCTLQKGDLIFTGTPEGVGKCMEGDLFEGFLFDQKVFHIEIALS